MYDLTSLLTTIAAASASIVAILGGFIASKLISIDGERNENLDRIKEIDEEIEHRTKNMNARQQEIDEEDATDFIFDNFGDFMSCRNLESVYTKSEHPDISFDALLPFWEKANDILMMFKEKKCSGEDVNGDDVPVELANDFRNDDFSYAICEKIASYYKNRSRTSSAPMFVNPMIDFEPPRIVGAWYGKNVEIIREEENAIKWLELQKKQCEARKASLKRPKGMLLGLVIFALFSLLCIVAPLLLTPFSTDSFACFAIVKYSALFVFAAGLFSIFGYLIWLLRWKEK